MKDKKMIVVDLDGTLLNINQECSEKTKKYLKSLKDLGYIIVIATGRILSNVVKITDGAVFANYIISNSGGLVYDMDNYRVISNNYISKNSIRNIFNYNSDDIDYITMCDLYHYYRYNYSGNMELFYDRKINDIDKFINDSDGILHMIIRFKKDDMIDKYYNMLVNDDIDIIVMQDSFSSKQWLEIFAKGVSKYNAIKIISDIENINNDNIIAFGDGLNDVDMLDMSGVGVAMGNALDEVKKVSDYVTISHNEDGVICFLKKYLNGDNLIG